MNKKLKVALFLAIMGWGISLYAMAIVPGVFFGFTWAYLYLYIPTD